MRREIKINFERGLFDRDQNLLSSFVPKRYKVETGDVIVYGEDSYIVSDVKKSTDFYDLAWVSPIEKAIDREIVERFLESFK